MALALNDHVILNTAILSPCALQPMDSAINVWERPSEIAFKTTSFIASPSLQVKWVTSDAFLKYSASKRVTSMDTPGLHLYINDRAKIPVLISAAIARQAK